MSALLDQILTFAIVLTAAVYVIWKVFLSVRLRTKLRYLLSGRKAPCEPEANSGGCAGGCAGCSLAAFQAHRAKGGTGR